MNDGLHFLDIVFFAMVAAFLVLRLRGVLGRRTGHERPPEKWPARGAEKQPEAGDDNVIDLSTARKPAIRGADEPPAGSPAAAGLAAVRYADPAFSTEEFMAGARAAFPMIVQAFAAGDRETLKPLLSPEVYGNFADAIARRETAGESLETELVAIRKVEIIEARLEDSIAHVTVRFVTEQVNLIRDSAGRVVEGDPAAAVEVVDEWTFCRDTRSRNPNWELVATRTPADS